MIRGDQTYLLLFATINKGTNYKAYSKEQLGDLMTDLASLDGNVGTLYAQVFIVTDTAQFIRDSAALLAAPMGA